MNNKLKSLNYHFRRILFEQFAIPKVRKMDISKMILKKYLPKNPVTIDCGAHNGADSERLFKVLGGTIHSFEPVDDLYLKLKRRASVNEGMFCYQIALSDTNGESEFYISEGESDGSSSLLPPLLHLKDHPRTLFQKKIVVKTKMLDT